MAVAASCRRLPRAALSHSPPGLALQHCSDPLRRQGSRTERLQTAQVALCTAGREVLPQTAAWSSRPQPLWHPRQARAPGGI